MTGFPFASDSPTTTPRKRLTASATSWKESSHSRCRKEVRSRERTDAACSSLGMGKEVDVRTVTGGVDPSDPLRATLSGVLHSTSTFSPYLPSAVVPEGENLGYGWICQVKRYARLQGDIDSVPRAIHNLKLILLYDAA